MPVFRPDADVGDDWDAELGGVLHLVPDEVLHGLALPGDDVEEEFVVDLEGHAGVEAAVADGFVDAQHGDLDEVGGGALQGGVDGGALGEATHVGVARGDIGDGADAAEDGLDGTFAADGGEGVFDELADATYTGRSRSRCRSWRFFDRC